MTTVAITGHRVPGGDKGRIVDRLKLELERLKPDKVITGMALGVDQWAALSCMSLHIPFVAAVPFQGQDEKWPWEAQRVYKIILDHASRVIEVCPPGFSSEKFHIRNEWMLACSDIVLAVWDGRPEGGTFRTIQSAAVKQKTMVVIDPRTA